MKETPNRKRLALLRQALNDGDEVKAARLIVEISPPQRTLIIDVCDHCDHCPECRPAS